ncbi:ribose 5-phosphate isomerase B [Clostridium sp. BNL1100]|uniref:ribose 5-phosphate isomerase B n=1 Tax=Clostridium sp. BNL1100 TaxID=755731 RepID=UPI00024A7A6F|nr:ribose 5-phosphate isomerase B [Clostridium sp. BNL1100]AEY66133.1 ribose 5-phosphate isomerase B [Clostridium sp. BNL1100]
MSIAIGCDEAGFQFKEVIKKLLIEKGLDVEDFGVYSTDPVLYPDIAVAVARSIAEGKHERGILICGTGIGMAIAANKVPGIRAAVCHDSFSTERSRKSNNAQIMTLGARVIGIELAKQLVNLWLGCEFDGGGSEAKVNKISEYENEFYKSCR